MALLDSIIHEVAEKFGLGEKASPLVSALFSLISDHETGGISGFLNKFTNAGLGNVVNSWVTTGANEPLTETQLESALGQSTLTSLADRAGVSVGKASSALSFLIPLVIDKLTPNGVIPTTVPSLSSLLTGGLGTVAAAGTAASAGAHRAAAAATDAAENAGGGLLKLLPLLLLGLLAFLGYQWCNRPATDTTHTATTHTAAPAATVAPKVNSALILVRGEDGMVKVTGVVPDQATKDKILAELKAVYGEGKYSADITVNPNAQPAGWFARLGDIFKSLTVPGAEFYFDGDSIKVAGAAAAASLVDKLKALFPTWTINSAILNVADAVKAANEKATAALASLTGTSNVDDVVKALNLQIINFASGKATIPPENQEILKKSAEAIKAMPAGTKIEVGGHTDNRGAAAGNQKLSEARANAVNKYLVGLGVKADQLTAKGYGPEKPVATNDTEEGRFKNRRIEFSVVK